MNLDAELDLLLAGKALPLTDGLEEKPLITAEQILEVECPVCKVPPGTKCDRSKKRAGKSHVERMWIRQGHKPEELKALRQRMEAARHEARVRRNRTEEHNA